MKHVGIVERAFRKYAEFAYDNKWKLVLISVLVNGLFGLGLLSLSLNNGIDALFLNKRSETKQLEQNLKGFYPDTSGSEFKPHSSVKIPLSVDVIVFGKAKENLLDPIFINQTQFLIDFINNISITSDYLGPVSYEDLCARNSGNCVIRGRELLEQLRGCPDTNMCSINTSSLELLYPKNTYLALLDAMGNMSFENDRIVFANYIRLRFYLRQDTKGTFHDSKAWQRKFTNSMSEFRNEHIDVVYCHSTSLYEELDENTYPDIRLFSLSFTTLIFCLSVYASGGDCVSKRMNIGRMGIIVVPLSILGAWGLLSGTGLEFTNTVAIMPYFALYYEVNNMMTTFHSLPDPKLKLEARDRTATALASSGIPITIKTITYITTFVAGINSDYYGMKLFSVYTVTTVLFIYMNHMVFFTACLAIHEQRIDAHRHFCTCHEIQPRSEAASTKSCCFLWCCTGEKPTAKISTSSKIERVTRKLLSNCVLLRYTKWPVMFFFLVFMGLSIWQVVSFKVSIFRPEDIASDSYFRKFDAVNKQIFPSNFYVSFSVPGYVLRRETAVNDILNIESKIKINQYIDPASLISWCDEYVNAVNNTLPSDSSLMESVTSFLSLNPTYQNDFAYDGNGNILYSRFYARSLDVHSVTDIRNLKESLLRENEISDSNDNLENNIRLSQETAKAATPDGKGGDKDLLTIYAPIFLYTDKYFKPLIESIIHISVLVCVNVFLMTLVGPHPRSLGIIAASFASSVLGLFGFMSVFNVELTPFSMIIAELGTCYMVDTNTHIMYSFYNKAGIDRWLRAHDMLSTTSVMLFNTTLASFLGMLVLFAVKSYVFLTVMKIIMTTTAICCIYACLVLPITLSTLGPKDENIPRNPESACSVKTIKIPQQYINKESLKCNGSNLSARSGESNSQEGAFDNKGYISAYTGKFEKF